MDLEKSLETLRMSPSPTFTSPEERRHVQRFRDTLTVEIRNRKIPRPGETLPSFELPDPLGRTIKSDQLLEKGPLALFFFRGSW